MNQQSEIDLQGDVFDLLGRHPTIAWAKRINVGGAYLKGRWVNFGFEGCADIIGQTKSGHFFACEVKRPGQQPTVEQRAFLSRINHNGGLGFVGYDLEQIAGALNAWALAMRKNARSK